MEARPAPIVVVAVARALWARVVASTLTAARTPSVARRPACAPWRHAPTACGTATSAWKTAVGASARAARAGPHAKLRQTARATSVEAMGVARSRPVMTACVTVAKVGSTAEAPVLSAAPWAAPVTCPPTAIPASAARRAAQRMPSPAASHRHVMTASPTAESRRRTAARMPAVRARTAERVRRTTSVRAGSVRRVPASTRVAATTEFRTAGSQPRTVGATAALSARTCLAATATRTVSTETVTRTGSASPAAMRPSTAPRRTRTAAATIRSAGAATPVRPAGSTATA